MLATLQPNGQFFNFQGMVIAIKQTHPPSQNGGVKQDVTVWDGQESKDVTFWADPAKGKHPIASVDIKIEKSYSLKGVVKEQYTNWNLYLSQFPAPIVGIAAPQQGQQQGGNSANAAPIANAMAANNVNYAAPQAQAPQPVQQPTPQPIPQPQVAPQVNGRERNINLQSARKDALEFLKISHAEHITEEMVFMQALRFADWAMGTTQAPTF